MTPGSPRRGGEPGPEAASGSGGPPREGGGSPGPAGGAPALQTVKIERIVTGGDGLGRLDDGRVVFVARTAPGERVEVEPVEAHKGWARGRAVRIVEPAPERREAACPYYDECGGCQLQHLTYEAQLSAKSGIVHDSLRRLGGLSSVEPPDVVASPREWGYRNRVTFVLRRAGGAVVAGFHALDDPARVIDVEDCPLAEPAIRRAWSELRAAWGPAAERLPPGRELRLTLRATLDGAVGLTVAGGEDVGDPGALIEAVSALRSVWLLDPSGDIAWYAGERVLVDRWGEHELRLAGNSFVQVNREVAAAIDAHVLDSLGDVAGRRVLELYCGFGVRALELAWRGARVVGIDADPHAIAMATEAAVESGASARFVAAPVERALAAEPPAHAVVLNPPRRGLARRVVDTLLTRPPARILYVSCDPATLARDLKALAPGFEVTACRAFDMFPQTAHVETVVALARGAAA